MESFDSAWFDSLRPHGNAERLSVEDRLHELLAIVQVAAGDEGLDAVLLVGGYAGMPHLARAIARACGPGCNIVVPDDPSAALAEGVVRAAAARTGAPGAPAEVALRVDMLDDEIRLLVGLDQAVTLVPRGSPLGRSFTTRRQFVPQGETTPIARIVLGDDLRTPRLASLRLGPKYAGRPTSVTTRVESLAMTDDQLTGNLEISFEAPDARLGPVRISIDRTLAKIR